MQAVQNILREEFQLASLQKPMIINKRKRDKQILILNIRTGLSEIIDKTSVSCGEAGSFNISDGKGEKRNSSLKKFP